MRVWEAPQRFLGLEVGARMTALETSGGWLLHSPIAVDPGSVGPVRWLLAPNLLHHLHVRPWLAAGVEGWAARGLPEKRPDLRFAGVVRPGEAPFGEEVALFPLTCLPITNEVVALHRPSRTLVVTDLLFHFPPTSPWLTRAAMFCACAWPGCRSSLLEVAAMHRPTARRELGAILEQDFDRIVLAHGEVVESGGKEALRSAYRWLGL